VAIRENCLNYPHPFQRLLSPDKSGFATNACESSKVWSLAQRQGIKEISETVNGNHEADEGLNGFTGAAHRQRFSFTYQRR